jgi:superfamily II DNA or RNA helicase
MQLDMFRQSAPQVPDLGLRPYQQEAREAIHAQLATHRGTVAVLATGCGKTRIVGAVAWDYRLMGRQVLILCPTIELCRQMARSMSDLGLSVGIEQASNVSTRPLPDVTVASVATMRGRRLDSFSADDFGLVVFDECFVAGTMVDGRPIESVVAGDRVTCVDHGSGAVVRRVVTRVFRKRASRIFTLRIGETEIKCTGNHPIFVRGKGYVDAKEVEPGDMCCVRSGAGSGRFVDMQELRGDFPGHKTQGKAAVDVLGRVQAAAQGCGNDCDESRHGTGEFRAHACQKSDAVRGDKKEDDGNAGEDRAQAYCARREWKGSHCGGGRLACCVGGWVGNRAHSAHEHAKGEGWLGHALQTGLGTSIVNGDDRGGREQPCVAVAEGAGRQEGGFLAWSRVDSVTSDESSGAGGFDVYNLEVEGAHTYFANNVLVHNCHLSVSKRCTSIFEHFPPAKRLGVTATPDRADRKSLASVYDSVAYDMPLLKGIEGGWLVPLRFRSVETDWDPSRLRELAGDVEPEAVAEELTRSGCLSAAVHAMCDLAGSDRAIAFLPTVASSMAFCAEVNAVHRRSPNVAQWAAHVDGTTPQKIRDEVFAAFRSGVTRVVSNVGVLVEGWDAPHATVCAVLAPTRSRARLAQMIGRVTRTHPGKEHALVLDFCPGRLAKGRLASPVDVLAGDIVSDELAERLRNMDDVGEYELAVQEDEAARARAREAMAEEISRKQARKSARASLRITPSTAVYGLQEHDMHEILSGRGDLAIKCAERGVDAKQVDAERKASGMCSLKQARLFAQQGLNPNMSADLAKRAMAVISRNNWQAAPWMRTHKDFAPS